MRFSKLIIISALIIGAVCGTVLMMRDQLLVSKIESRLQRLSRDLGEEITIEGATLQGINRVSIRGLQVGVDRWLHVQRLDITLDRESLIADLLSGRRPKVLWAYLIQPTLSASGSSLKEIAKGQEARIQRVIRRMNSISSSKSAPTSHPPSSHEGRLRRALSHLPNIEVTGGKLSGTHGGLFIHQATLSLRGDTLKGSWRGEAPRTGYCTAEGDLNTAKVTCHENFKFPIGDRFEVAGRQLEWRGGQRPQLKLMGLHLSELESHTSKSSRLPFSQLKLDLTAGLSQDDLGKFPVETAIVFPGGGRLIASGFASLQELELSTQVSGFPMHTLAHDQSGILNADARVWAKWREGAATFEGKLSLVNAMIRHEKLAEDAVGPLNLSADGVMRLAWIPREPKRFKLSVENARAQIGDITATLSASWDQVGTQPRLIADLEVPRLKAERFAASIPHGLMPHLQPVELSGHLGFSGKIDLDFANLDQTELKFKPDLRKLKVLSYNEQIDFQALRGSFDTRFEMPDGEVFTRVTGPETERWVELDEMPKLLPKAVISQEDGGFYKHGGISLFHLRGSLVRNLKEGRFVRGGSTLTMQLIKNLYLHRRKTLSRKLEEVCLTWLIEKELSKDELITLYLNIVEFGPNLFGIKEAARHYFQKAPIDLRPEEVAAITRLLPGPRLYAKFFERKQLSKAYTQRVNRLLKLLVKKSYLKENEWSAITPTSLWEASREQLKSEEDSLTQEPQVQELELDEDQQDPSNQRTPLPRPREVFEPF